MPKSLGLIPIGQAVVDARGAITIFFRQRWQELQDSFQTTPTVAAQSNPTPLNGPLATTAIFTTKTGGRYRASWDLYRLVIDGAGSSLQATIGWTQNGVAKTHVGRSMATDSLAADPTDTPIAFSADANSDITIAVAYTSTTPNQMQWNYDAVVELFA